MIVGELYTSTEGNVYKVLSISLKPKEDALVEFVDCKNKIYSKYLGMIYTVEQRLLKEKYSRQTTTKYKIV